MNKDLEFFVENKLATIVLNRPESYNSFNQNLREELRAVLKKVEDNSKILVVLLKGNGKGFSSGADLNEPFPPPISEHLSIEYKPIFEMIIKSRLIFVSVVHGSAAGISSALAMACDFMIMGENARISLIFSNLGLVPDGGSTWLLERAMGYRKALEIIIEGKHITADQCLKFGLANKIVDEKILDEEAKKWALSLVKRAPLAMSASKQLLRNVSNINYLEAFDQEGKFQDKMSVSEDFFNARISFLKKQKPQFKGK